MVRFHPGSAGLRCFPGRHTPLSKGEDRVPRKLPGGPLKQKGHNYNRVWPLSFSTFGVVQSVYEEGNTSCMASRERQRPEVLPLQGLAYSGRLAPGSPLLPLRSEPGPTFHHSHSTLSPPFSFFPLSRTSPAGVSRRSVFPGMKCGAYASKTIALFGSEGDDFLFLGLRLVNVPSGAGGIRPSRTACSRAVARAMADLLCVAARAALLAPGRRRRPGCRWPGRSVVAGNAAGLPGASSPPVRSRPRWLPARSGLAMLSSQCWRYSPVVIGLPSGQPAGSSVFLRICLSSPGSLAL